MLLIRSVRVRSELKACYFDRGAQKTFFLRQIVFDVIKNEHK